MMQPSTEPKPSTAPLGQKQLEQALGLALNTGVGVLAEQIHYILAYSQMLGLTPITEAYRPKPLTISQARLNAMLEFVYPPTLEQAQYLYRQTAQLNSLSARLHLQARLIGYLPVRHQLHLTFDLLREIEQVEDRVVRARIVLNIVQLPFLKSGLKPVFTQSSEIVQITARIANGEARIRGLVALAQAMQDQAAVQLIERILDDLDTLAHESLQANTIAILAHKVILLNHVGLFERLKHSASKLKTPSERAKAWTALTEADPDPNEARLHALEAISAIVNEEERAEALIIFAPNIEYADATKGYPTALQKALEIAIGILRRSTRAKAFVALAPNLTPDLQGEALAAVHSLTNERDRAMLLADLAPRLPSNMLIASLAVAHTMREQDARAHALGVLAHHVPDHARNQTMLDALAAASNLPHHYERVRALIGLTDILPTTLQDQAFTSALETTRLIENENARARAISLLSNHLPAHLLERALDATYQIRDSQQRINTLASLLPRLNGARRQEALHNILETASQMPFEYRRARALVMIASHLDAEFVPRALAMADDLHDPYDRVTAYIALSQNVAPEQRPDLIVKAWGLIRRISEGYDRASALVSIAPFLPANAQGDLKKLALSIVQSIGDGYDRSSVIGILAPLMVEPEPITNQPTLPEIGELMSFALKTIFEIPYQPQRAELLAEAAPLWVTLFDQDARYQLWRETAQRLKTLPLADVLLCLRGLLPVIRALGGNESIDKIVAVLGGQVDKQPRPTHLSG
ncbi:MAG: hypothetical protein MUF87_09290 [Anaerolineae bacterium]|nr:hypothetical protein [Anaerolineae bacterium]